MKKCSFTFNVVRNVPVMLMAAAVLFLAGTVVNAENTQDANADKDKPALAGPQADSSSQNSKKKFAGGDRAEPPAISKALESLNLTADQKDKINALLVDDTANRMLWNKEHGEEVKAIREEIKKARQDKNKQGVEDASKRLKDLMSQAPKSEDLQNKISQLLTEDQQKTFNQKLEELQKQHQDKSAGNKKVEKNKADRKGRGGKDKK